MKSHHSILTVAVLGAAAFGVHVFLGSATSAPAKPATPPPAPLVSISPVLQRPVAETEDFTGHVEAMEWVGIRSRVAGHIVSVCFAAGQLVKKDDVLFRIDDRWHKAAADSADAAVARAEADLKLAEQDAARTSALVGSRVVSREESDSRLAKVDVARAALLSAKAAKESAHLDLEYTLVRSPIDGRVSRALLTVGNYVTGPTTELTTVASTGTMHVYADLDETSYLRLQQHLKQEPEAKHVDVRLEDDGAAPIQGEIESLDNRINPGSGSIMLRILAPNPDGLLTPGLFVRVRVPLTSQKPAMLVDESSVGTDQGQKFVLVVNEQRQAQYRTVKLGPIVDGKRMIRSGLQGGENIIVNGLQRVHPGGTVRTEVAQVKSGAKDQVAAR